ncbi:MAG: PH domain-containing protein [Bacteroidia bacterium]|nr:PH domain-containing protein [Bacteroidia bacterium]
MTFKSSITRGGAVLTPHTIEITDKSVIWSKRNKFLIGTDTITIPRDKIASIEINEKLWGADVIITGIGGSKIIAVNFTGSDANKIKELLQ